MSESDKGAKGGKTFVVRIAEPTNNVTRNSRKEGNLVAKQY
jgi:hypothetical protein